MCGRYGLFADPRELEARFRVAFLPEGYRPRWNIAPTDDVLAVAADGRERRAGFLRWGLVPRWADDPASGSRMINARSETADRKPAFRDAFRHRRCLVPASGFYEWRRDPDGRTPFWIFRPGKSVLAVAGLWEEWPGGGDEPLATCAILTRPATPALRGIHPRMPVLLDAEAEEAWLDPAAGEEELRRILHGAGGAGLEARRVSHQVNRPGPDGPDLLDPVPDDPDLSPPG